MKMELLNFTPQLFYHPTETSKQHFAPQQIASSVLFKTDKDYFLITAKHAFKEIKISDVIILLNEGGSIRLYGDMAFFIKHNQYDNLDIAVLKLDVEQTQRIKERYSFLHYKNIDFTHDYVETNTYMLLGFINDQTQLKGKNFLSTPFGFLTQIKRLNKIYDLGLNEIENFTLRYNRRKQGFLFDKVKQFGPKDLTGLSGGGIWHTRQHPDKPYLQYCFLVGIMIEQLRGTNRGIVVGTKISLILGILKSYFGIALET